MSLKTKLSILLVVSFITSSAQIRQSIEREEAYRGENFRLTANVNTVDSGLVVFWAYQKDKDEKVIRHKTKRRTLQSSSPWRQIVLTGQFKNGATALTFGIWSTSTISRFNVDHIQLEVQNKGVWKRVDLQNGDFEASNDSSKTLVGWTVDRDYTVIIDTLTSYVGKKSLYIGQQDLQRYGNFREHGNSVKLNGIDLYYETYGEGEPMVLLHGNNESIRSFRYQIDAFRDKYKVIAVDSRGQGKSSNNKKKIDNRIMAEDVFALLNHLKLDSANIVGWSDGGNTGLILTLEHPEKVKSLTIMGANLYPDRDAVQKKFLREYRWALRYATILSIFNRSKWRNKVRVGRVALNDLGVSPQDLQRINTPTLVLAGERDVVNENHTKLIAGNIGRSKLVILKGLTHYAPQDDPAYFNKVVEQFLSDEKD